MVGIFEHTLFDIFDKFIYCLCDSIVKVYEDRIDVGVTEELLPFPASILRVKIIHTSCSCENEITDSSEYHSIPTMTHNRLGRFGVFS